MKIKARTIRTTGYALLCIAFATTTCAGNLSKRQRRECAKRYLNMVRQYADAMIEHGRDIYGSVHSPLFASTLDRRTMRIPKKRPASIIGIREGDRALI